MKASVNYLHHQGTDWLRELEFYKQEIGILTKRLEEVISKNNSKEITAQVEHFQNKFIMLNEQADILKHNINVREQEIEKIAKKHPEHINEKSPVLDDTILERMKDFAHSVADTRFEFNQFLVKVL